MSKRIITMSLTQKEAVLEYLRQGKAITPAKAQRLFNVERLADVIYKLKKDGHRIHTTLCHDENGKRYGEYFLPTVVGREDFNCLRGWTPSYRKVI